MAFLGVAFIATGRSTRSRFFLVAGLALVGVVAFVLVRDGPRWVAISGPISGSVALASVLLGLLTWAQIVSLPRGVARVLGVGMRSRALVFDNRLIEFRGQFYAAWRLAESDPDRRAEALTDAEAHVHRMRALRPPDAKWAMVRNDMADDFERWVGLMRTDLPPDRLADSVEAAAPVYARWMQIRDQAALDQRLLATPARRRRGELLWLVVMGFSGLAIGGTSIRGYDLTAMPMASPQVWFALGTLSLGVFLLVDALILAIRR